MKIAIAIDSFKGSLSSTEAGEAAAVGIKRIYPDAQIDIIPLADGGEGTVKALAAGKNAALRNVQVTDPLGRKIQAEYCITNGTAVIEMATAAGITLLKSSELDPMKTTTYGVGELISDAISQGCRNFIIGIGGSATNDGGSGMLQALGFGLLDKYGKQIPFGAKGLAHLDRISTDNAIPELCKCRFRVACDVTNVLCGEKGCSAVFAPQKGASPEAVEIMDKLLYDYSEKAKIFYPHSDRNSPGAGAAGGLGFALKTFLNAELASGVKIILEETDFENRLKGADFLVTGEGRLDYQTVMGKAPCGAAKLAEKHNIPVIAFSGCIGNNASLCNENGIDAFFPILRSISTLDEALDKHKAAKNLADTAEQAFRLIKRIRK